jgi:MOSC domain-containing protein YiiM
VSGQLIGIARTPELRAAMEQLDRASVTIERGIEGDARGRKLNRQVTLLFREGWEDACREVGDALPWITRRANLYIEGVERPRNSGGRVMIGEVELQIMLETAPCMLMERAQSGLRAALSPEWRGGVCCNVVRGGVVRLGDAVTISG